ncbi:DNA-directed RNA polymerase subunit beta [Paenibacillus lycopersici]|uniref:DNA-directed RNA polymerase subunit beta n=2 Tax=Paenibacillus lycopersici TaxID=2704462 RepID=A0A6C0G8W3_9BACL|nr:DNA-directed RNA polymerase subunit beta [Paenibacillus lycopersici]
MESVTSAERSPLLGASVAGDPARRKAQQAERPAAGKQSKAAARKKRHPAVRVIRWLLLKSIVPILCVLAVIGGMYIGYAVLGKQPGDEIFQAETWKHVYDLVFAD